MLVSERSVNDDDDGEFTSYVYACGFVCVNAGMIDTAARAC